MMVINITNKMFLGDRKTPFNIVFDEAWDMLRAKQSEVFIETLDLEKASGKNATKQIVSLKRPIYIPI